MTRVYYNFWDKEFNAAFISPYLHLLSEEDQARISRFRQPRDACLSLIGRLLLLVACKDFNITITHLRNLQFSPNKKPVVPGFSFSISHAANLVVAAVSNDIEVGIDVEDMSAVETADLENYIATLKFDIIPGTTNTRKEFFTRWTCHEAVLKAYGTGFLVDLEQLQCNDDMATIGNTHWYLRQINIADGFSCHLASSERTTDLPVIAVKEESFCGFRRQVHA